MSPERKLRMLEAISEKNPHMRITNAMWKVRRAEKREELSRPAPNPIGLVAMIRKLTGKA